MVVPAGSKAALQQAEDTCGALDSAARAARRRVMFFNHTSKLGGGEIALYNLVCQIDTRTYEPLVVVGAEGPLFDNLSAAGIAAAVVPIAPSIVETRKDTLGVASLFRVADVFRSGVYAVKLARFIRSNGVDLVHTNSLKADLLGGMAARLAGVPVVWHVRDRIDDDYLPAVTARFFRFLCKFLPSRVIANSSATADTIVRSAGRPSGSLPLGRKTEVVHDGVVIREAAVQSRAVNTSAPLVGLVGRISPWKGQHVFLAAAAKVRERFPDVRFQIIGSVLFGEQAYENMVRSLCTELGLDDCVEFTGFRTDVPDLIHGLDILVHASTLGEPFGQVVVEGMAEGKPVIATNGGAIPEIVQDETTGLLVPMGDADSMAAAICRLIADPALGLQMGRRGRERVENHFTIQHTAARVQSIYGEIFANPRSK